MDLTPGPGTLNEGWTNDQVTLALGHMSDMNQSSLIIMEATTNTTHYLDVMTTAIYFLVFIASMNFGYMISHYFLPTPRDIGGY